MTACEEARHCGTLQGPFYMLCRFTNRMAAGREAVHGGHRSTEIDRLRGLGILMDQKVAVAPGAMGVIDAILRNRPMRGNGVQKFLRSRSCLATKVVLPHVPERRLKLREEADQISRFEILNKFLGIASADSVGREERRVTPELLRKEARRDRCRGIFALHRPQPFLPRLAAGLWTVTTAHAESTIRRLFRKPARTTGEVSLQIARPAGGDANHAPSAKSSPRQTPASDKGLQHLPRLGRIWPSRRATTFDRGRD